MIGGSCCQVKGILCNIALDFVTLIQKDLIIKIKIDQIAAISRSLDLGIEFKDQADEGDYEGQNFFTEREEVRQEISKEFKEDSDQKTDIEEEKARVNKRQKTYTQIEE